MDNRGTIARNRDSRNGGHQGSQSALADKGKLTADLARAVEANEANEAFAKRLRDRGQTADILDLASGIGRVLFRSKKDP